MRENDIISFYLDLIEAKVIGCFDLLDEESKLPTPKAEHFTMEVHNRNKGHARLDVRAKSFLIKLNYCFFFVLFSCQENQNYVLREKYVMMKVLLFNILLAVSFIRL